MSTCVCTQISNSNVFVIVYKSTELTEVSLVNSPGFSTSIIAA